MKQTKSHQLIGCLMMAVCLAACASKTSKPVNSEKVLLASVSDDQAEQTTTNDATNAEQPAPSPLKDTAFSSAGSIMLDPADVERYLVQRMAMANDPNYDPYSLTFLEQTLLNKHFTLAKDATNSIEQLNEPLKALDKVNPLSVRLNLVLAKFLSYVAKQSKDAEQKQALTQVAEQKRMRAAAVLQSILNSGNGKTPETAYVVINLTEEHAVLDHFNLRKDKQALMERDGKQYDVITAKEKDGQKHTLYFDINHFYGKSPNTSTEL